jgi:hypothetical protein
MRMHANTRLDGDGQAEIPVSPILVTDCSGVCLYPQKGCLSDTKFTHLSLAADVFYANTISVEPYGYMRTAAGALRDY